ncbi:MAG: XdhC family protein [Anaerolineae bacterium]
MKDIYRALAGFLARKEKVALATIVRTRGSVPREIGAKMIIYPEGQHVGTIGGGCGEAEVMRAALDALADGKPRLVQVDLTGDISLESDGICGGIMEVFIEPWEAGGELLRALEESRPAALVTIVSAGGTLADRVGRKALLQPQVPGTLEVPGTCSGLGLREAEEAILEEAHAALKEGRSLFLEREIAGEKVSLFVDVHLNPPTLLIAGAGHIAVPLARMAKMLDFRVVVLDDRASFANRERFPEADQLLVSPFTEALRHFPLDESTYVILITRGHRHDVECLRELIDAPVAYIGMIGSRRRIRGVFQLLKEEGINPQKLARVHAPIGLDIGAETPAEIALSIIAEVVKVRRGGSARSLKLENGGWRK